MAWSSRTRENLGYLAVVVLLALVVGGLLGGIARTEETAEEAFHGERVAQMPNGAHVYAIRTPQGDLCYVYHLGGIWCRPDRPVSQP